MDAGRIRMNWRPSTPGERPLPAAHLRAVLERLEAPVAAIAFWLAVLLPVGYLTLLASGIGGQPGLELLVSLVGVHVIALVAGRNHRR